MGRRYLRTLGFNGFGGGGGLRGFSGTTSTWALDSSGNIMYGPDGRRIQIDFETTGPVTSDLVIQKTREILGSPNAVVVASSATSTIVTAPEVVPSGYSNAGVNISPGSMLPQISNMVSQGEQLLAQASGSMVPASMVPTSVAPTPMISSSVIPTSAAQAAGELLTGGMDMVNEMSPVMIVKKPGGNLGLWVLGGLGVWLLLRRGRRATV